MRELLYLTLVLPIVSCLEIKASHIYTVLLLCVCVCVCVVFRSIKGYTPLDFAATVGKKKKWKLARMLDDRHLLPRAKFLKLEKCIIEVWR